MKNKILIILAIFLFLFVSFLLYYFLAPLNSQQSLKSYSGTITNITSNDLIIEIPKHPLDDKNSLNQKSFLFYSKTKIYKTSSTIKGDTEYQDEINKFEIEKEKGGIVLYFPSRFKKEEIKKEEIKSYQGYNVLVYYHENKNNNFIDELVIDNKIDTKASVLDIVDSELLIVKGVVSENNSSTLRLSEKRLDIMTEKEIITENIFNLETLKNVFILKDEKPNNCVEENSCRKKDGFYLFDYSYNLIKKGDLVLLTYRKIKSDFNIEEIYVY